MKSVYDKFLGFGAVAVIGASDSRSNFGRAIYKTLRNKGYQVYPVNPNAQTVDGDNCYPHVKAVPAPVDAIVMAVSPRTALSLIESIADSGVKRIWFQRGADFSEAAASAREAGLETVEDRCILMHTKSVTGVHAVHRFFSRITGHL